MDKRISRVVELHYYIWKPPFSVCVLSETNERGADRNIYIYKRNPIKIPTVQYSLYKKSSDCWCCKIVVTIF